MKTDINEAPRYEKGEIWWHEMQDDLRAIAARAVDCVETSRLKEMSTAAKIGCRAQNAKLTVWFYVLKLFKYLVGLVVDMYCSVVDKASGGQGTDATGSDRMLERD